MCRMWCLLAALLVSFIVCVSNVIVHWFPCGYNVFVNIIMIRKSIPVHALWLLEVQALRISRKSAHGGSNVVIPTHRQPFPSRKSFWYSFMLEVEFRTGPYSGRKDCQQTIPITPLEINPTTFRLVAQCLSQMRHRVTHSRELGSRNMSIY
jgi:hypothetical protein